MSLTVDSGQTLQRCLALDIGGTKIASAIVKNGEIQQRKQISTPQDDAAQAMHQTLAQLLKEYEDSLIMSPLLQRALLIKAF